MSVINKMLRDLDQRQSTEPIPLQGTVSIPVSGIAVRRRAAPATRWAWGFLAVAVVAGVPAALWQAGLLDHLMAGPSAVPPPPAPVVQAVPVPAVAPAVSVPIPPVPVAEPAPLPPPVAQAPLAPVPAPVTAAPPKAQVAASAPVLRMDRGPAEAKSHVAAVPASAVAAAPAAAATPASAANPAVRAPSDPPPNPQRQQLAAKETIANAQALWSGGSHDAAVDLMQEAITTAERNPANGTVLPSLVREWARMQLAESRPAPVWDLLTRLEPQLRNEPDLWAVRANAAQRLGRHQDSVQAYMTALQSRPNEQRWLLGAAVSLAALGQTANAAEMADKARAVGPISRDVQAYLRQMGVPMKDQ